MGHGGKVHGNLLECPFHAWRYDGIEGIVREIPYSEIHPATGETEMHTYVARDRRNRWIWMWYHPEDIAPLFEGAYPRMFRSLTGPSTMYKEWNVYGSIQNMAENGVDVAHFKYIHGTANVPLGDSLG